MSKIIASVTFLALLSGFGGINIAAAPARSITVPPVRVIEMLDVVNGAAIPEVAAKLLQLSTAGTGDIWMLINSPGGAVGAGTTVVDAMRLAKARGVKIKCVTGVVAASMAFIMLAHCDEKYVLANAKLLFHPMSVGLERARVQELVVGLQVIRDRELLIMEHLRKEMGLSTELFHTHYFAETLWDAEDLAAVAPGFHLKVVDDVKGLPNLFNWRKPREFTMNYLQYGIPEKLIRALTGDSTEE